MLTGLPPRIELESLILKTCTSMTEERDVNVDADFTLSDDNAFDLFLTSFSGLRILVIHLLQPDTSEYINGCNPWKLHRTRHASQQRCATHPPLQIRWRPYLTSSGLGIRALCRVRLNVQNIR